MTTDVNLPKAREPVFPDRCVSCGLESPGDHLRISTNAVGWWTVALWTHGARFSVEVPSCESCRLQMIRQLWLRRAVCGIFVLIGVAVASHTLGSVRGTLNRWAAMGIMLLCLVPWMTWEAFFPRPFELTAFSDTVDYEFRDEEYARDFAGLNQPAEIEKTNERS